MVERDQSSVKEYWAEVNVQITAEKNYTKSTTKKTADVSVIHTVKKSKPVKVHRSKLSLLVVKIAARGVQGPAL